MSEYNRLTDVLLGYWDDLKGDRDIPLENDVNPEDLDSNWDSCFLAHLLPQGGYRYSYLGKNLIEAYGNDVEEEEIDFLVSPDGHRTVEKFDQTIKEKRPISDKGEFVNSKKLLIKYRQLLLPLADFEGNVSYILGGMKWKAF